MCTNTVYRANDLVFRRDSGAIVDIIAESGATATDACDPAPVISHDGPAEFPSGNTVVTITAMDDSGNLDSEVFTVTVLPPLDLDVKRFQASNFNGKRPISFTLAVVNNGTVEANAMATLVGIQDGERVHSEIIEVYDLIGKGATIFNFAEFQPNPQGGDIFWTASIEDQDPDIDEATDVTSIK